MNAAAGITGSCASNSGRADVNCARFVYEAGAQVALRLARVLDT
jgi:hypothetical protein